MEMPTDGNIQNCFDAPQLDVQMSFPKTVGLQLVFSQAYQLGGREQDWLGTSDEGEEQEEEGGALIQRGSAAGHAWRGEEDPEEVSQ